MSFSSLTSKDFDDTIESDTASPMPKMEPYEYPADVSSSRAFVGTPIMNPAPSFFFFEKRALSVDAHALMQQQQLKQQQQQQNFFFSSSISINSLQSVELHLPYSYSTSSISTDYDNATPYPTVEQVEVNKGEDSVDIGSSSSSSPIGEHKPDPHEVYELMLINLFKKLKEEKEYKKIGKVQDAIEKVLNFPARRKLGKGEIPDDTHLAMFAFCVRLKFSEIFESRPNEYMDTLNEYCRRVHAASSSNIVQKTFKKVAQFFKSP